MRHGESEDNAAGRFGGRRAAPLSPRGHAQAKALSRWFADTQVDVVVSSGLARARETAEVVASELGLAAAVRPDWEEASYGNWEGLTFKEAARREPAAVRAWMRAPLTASPPGGESFQDVYERVARAATALYEEYRGRTIVLVTHSGPVRALVLHALGAPLEAALRLHVDVASVSLIDVYAESQVLVMFSRPVET